MTRRKPDESRPMTTDARSHVGPDHVQLRRAGAATYLLKNMPKDQILAAIRLVHSGRKHVPAEVAARLARHLGEEDRTTRELDVLRQTRRPFLQRRATDANSNA